MAKNIQEAEVIVTLRGEAAKRTLEEMQQEYKRLSDAARQAAKDGDDALSKKLDAQAQKLMKDMDVAKVNAKKFADVMKNINSASLKELRSAAKQLQSEINKLTPGTQEFITKSKQLQQVNTRIRQLTNSFKGLVEEEKAATLSVKGLADGFNKYFGMVTAGVAAVTGLSMAFRKCAEEAAKLDDTYADVMKTTGLLHEEVANLDQELMKIDTRTSREQLLLLARDAGKLGIQGRDNILGFVRAADQIQVALGEDLGEDAVKQLGKIADVLGYTKSMGVEKALLSIGSAINAVGQDSTASEAYLVEFTQRLAGVAAQANISAADLIGFASGLDQSAMKVEMAATAFQKFLMKLYEDPAKFAEYAKMEVQEFSNLLKKDASTAITTVLKALNEQGGFDSLVKTFDEMGLDGARAVTVLSSMAANLNAVTEAQELANVEFEKATSVTNEFSVKNNTLQAQLEKARKEFQTASTTLGQSLNPIMLKSTKLLTYLIKLLASHGKEIRNAAIAVAALTALIKAQAIADVIRTNGLKLWNTVSKTAEFLSNKLFAAYYRLTGQTLKYAAAQKAANAAASKSVYGLIAIGVAALVYKITELNNKMEENVEVTEKAQTTEEKIAETYAEEKGKIDALNKIINDNNISLDKRNAALLELKDIVPGYHADLTEEGVLINNNTSALEAYLVKLRQKIKMEAYKEDYKEAEKQIAAYEKKLEEAEQKKQELIAANGGEEPEKKKTVRKESGNSLLGDLLGINLPSTSGVVSMEEVNTEFGQLLEEMENTQEAINEKRKEQDKLAEKIGITIASDISDMQKEITDTTKAYDELIRNVVDEGGDQGAAMKRIKQLDREKNEAIAKIKEKYKAEVQTEDKENANLTQAQFDFLKERYDKLTKKEKAMVDKGYASLSEGESKALRARYAKLTKVAAAEVNKEYKEKQKAIEQAEREQENIAKQQYANNELTAKQYEDRLREIKVEYIKKKIDLAHEYGEDETAYLQDMLDAQLEAQKLAAAEMDRLAEEADKKLKQEHEKIQEEKRKLDELTKEGEEVRASLRTPAEVRNDEMSAELARLDKLHKAKALSEEEYEKAVKQLRKKYDDEALKERLANVQKYTEKANSILAEASNVVSAIRDAELAYAEATYQKELTAAGDNAEKREEVETQYEQKKLEIQKKYADADMAINIAKTIAAGALAAIQAFAQLGPIGGAVAAALIAVITAADVATIVAQRNAIKNTSVNSSSGSTSTPKTGERKVTGYGEGGNTAWSASDNTPVGIVHANEYVIPAWMKRREPRLIADLEHYRRLGSHGRSGSTSKGFAEGGHTSGNGMASGIGALANSRAEIEAAVETAIRRAMDDGAIRAYLVRRDLEELDAQTERFKKQTSR